MLKFKLKIVFFLCSTMIFALQGFIFAQTYNESDKETLRNFLRNSSAVSGKLNVDQLWNSGVVDTGSWYSSETWIAKITGITWNNDSPKRIRNISWSDKKLGGKLNLSGAAKLETVDCSKNKLIALDLSGNLVLKSFNCSEDSIRTLAIPNTPTLTELDFRGNGLKFSTMPVNKPQYNYFFWYPQRTLYFDNVQIYSRDTFKMLEPEAKINNGSTTYTTTFRWYDQSNNQEVTSLVQNINGTFKFDPALEGKTLSVKMYNTAFGSNASAYIEVINLKILGFIYNESDKEALRIFLRKEAADGLGNINKLWSCGVIIDTLVGYNNELWVPCVSGGITWDNNKPKHITRISWDNKGFGDSLDLTGCDSIVYLSCKNNSITGINTSTNAKLAELYCSNNQLEHLDVSKNKKLTKLNCAYNKLRFSTMTPKALFHTSYTAMPQDTIDGGTALIINPIDLSSEYNFKNQYGNNSITQYTWLKILDDGTEIPINTGDITNNNGIFTFNYTLTTGNYLCKMINTAFDSTIALVFKVYLIEVTGFFVNETQVGEDMHALLDCGINIADIRVCVNANEYPLVEIEGIASLTYSFTPNYGKNFIHINITNKEGITTNHILTVEKRLEADIFRTRWNDRLIVPLNIHNIVCSKVEWYKHTPEKDILLGRDPDKGYIQITETGSYFVIINDSYRSCFIDFELTPSNIPRVIPNPVASNRTFIVNTELDDDELKNAQLQIFTATGILINTFDVTAASMELPAPADPGTYSIFLNASGNTKIIKFIVVR